MSSCNLERFARLALDGVTREYPYNLSHTAIEAGSIESPRSLTPAFYGCFDWHSAVHGHWLLVRACAELDGSSFAEQCRAVLGRHLEPGILLAEREYIAARPAFERPYGLAWLLTLAAELDMQDDHEMQAWRDAIRPIEQVAADHLRSWLPKLSHPVRSGTHNQTAFSLVLVRDWALQTDNEAMGELIDERAMTFFAEDRDYPLHLEPSGEDFLSASLGAAWLMARVLEPGSLASWIDQTMPGLGRDHVFEPARPSDRSDGRLCHLDGLNLSRAWMLRDLVHALPSGDGRRTRLLATAGVHQAAGLEGVSAEHYAGSHWLGTFAAYLDARLGPDASVID